MKRGFNIQINFTNRFLYTFVAFAFVLIIGVGVFAYGTSTPSTFGHSSGELEEADPTVLASVKDGVSWDEVSGIPAGFADGIDDDGITSETDPTVLASVKDGVSWDEVSSKPTTATRWPSWSEVTSKPSIATPGVSIYLCPASTATCPGECLGQIQSGTTCRVGILATTCDIDGCRTDCMGLTATTTSCTVIGKLIA